MFPSLCLVLTGQPPPLPGSMCKCMCVNMHVYMCECVCMCRPDADNRCLPQSLSTLLLVFLELVCTLWILKTARIVAVLTLEDELTSKEVKQAGKKQ